MRKFVVVISMAVLLSCENKALHDSEEFKPREIHEQITFHFDKVEVDGIEYLILEKDNNNPHEGFGFMAFRANKLMEKQDTILAYVKTITEIQSLLYAKIYNVSPGTANDITGRILERNIEEQLMEIQLLEQTNLSGSTDTTKSESPNN